MVEHHGPLPAVCLSPLGVCQQRAGLPVEQGDDPLHEPQAESVPNRRVLLQALGGSRNLGGARVLALRPRLEDALVERGSRHLELADIARDADVGRGQFPDHLVVHIDCGKQRLDLLEQQPLVGRLHLQTAVLALDERNVLGTRIELHFVRGDHAIELV